MSDGDYQVIMPHYVALAVVSAGIVTKAAPIIRWMVGRKVADCYSYIARKGGTWRNLQVHPLG